MALIGVALIGLAMGAVISSFQLAIYGALGLIAAAGRGRMLTLPGLTIALDRGQVGCLSGSQH